MGDTAIAHLSVNRTHHFQTTPRVCFVGHIELTRRCSFKEQVHGRELGHRGLFTPDLNTYGPHTNVWGMGVVSQSHWLMLSHPHAYLPILPSRYSTDVTDVGPTVHVCPHYQNETPADSQVHRAPMQPAGPGRDHVRLVPGANRRKPPDWGGGHIHDVPGGAAAPRGPLHGRRSPGAPDAGLPAARDPAAHLAGDADIEAFCLEFIVGMKSEPSAASARADDDDDDEEGEARDVLGDLGFPGQQAAARAARRQSQSQGGGGGGGSSQQQDSRFWGQGGGNGAGQSVSQAYAEAESQLLAQRR